MTQSPVTGSQEVLEVENLCANAGDARDSGLIPGLGRSLGLGMETHSSILAWETLWTEESGGLQCRVAMSWTLLNGHSCKVQ